MIKIFLLAVAASATLQVQAQTLKVVKVKGKRAVVETTSGTLREGQTVSVGDGGGFASSSSSGGSEHTGPRTHFVGGSGSFSSAKVAGTSNTLTSIALSALYGWNPGNNMEYGIIAAFATASGGGASSSSFGAGGKFDWDFTNNIAPVNSLFSAGAEATFGQASSGGASSTEITVFPMASWKYFILNTPTCVRFDGGVKLVQSSGSGKSSTDTNPAVNVGLFTYF